MESSLSHKKKKPIGFLFVIIIIVIIILIQGLLRLILDGPIYAQAKEAYLQADCETAAPLYSSVISKTRLLDFGKIGKRSFQIKSECEAYTIAAQRSFNDMIQFSISYPESPLIPSLKSKFLTLLNSFEEDTHLPFYLDETICDSEQYLLDKQWLETVDTLPRFKYFCSIYSISQGMNEKALSKVTDLFATYPSHEVTSLLTDQFVETTLFCPLIYKMEKNTTITQYFPSEYMYLFCGYNYFDIGDYDRSIDLFELFIDHFPNSPNVEDAKKSLATALIENARQSGAGTISPPGESGTAPSGTVRVVIQNDSPDEITLVFNGTETRFDSMSRCETCKEYSFSPLYCPEKGPIFTFDLLPGVYDVLVESRNDKEVIPFTGKWDLTDGKEFYSCFFIVKSTIGP